MIPLFAMTRSIIENGAIHEDNLINNLLRAPLTAFALLLDHLNTPHTIIALRTSAVLIAWVLKIRPNQRYITSLFPVFDTLMASSLRLPVRSEQGNIILVNPFTIACRDHKVKDSTLLNTIRNFIITMKNFWKALYIILSHLPQMIIYLLSRFVNWLFRMKTTFKQAFSSKIAKKFIFQLLQSFKKFIAAYFEPTLNLFQQHNHSICAGSTMSSEIETSVSDDIVNTAAFSTLWSPSIEESVLPLSALTTSSASSIALSAFFCAVVSTWRDTQRLPRGSHPLVSPFAFRLLHSWCMTLCWMRLALTAGIPTAALSHAMFNITLTLSRAITLR
jgi:hypothetical protein